MSSDHIVWVTSQRVDLAKIHATREESVKYLARKYSEKNLQKYSARKYAELPSKIDIVNNMKYQVGRYVKLNYKILLFNLRGISKLTPKKGWLWPPDEGWYDNITFQQ